MTPARQKLVRRVYDGSLVLLFLLPFILLIVRATVERPGVLDVLLGWAITGAFVVFAGACVAGFYDPERRRVSTGSLVLVLLFVGTCILVYPPGSADSALGDDHSPLGACRMKLLDFHHAVAP